MVNIPLNNPFLALLINPDGPITPEMEDASPVNHINIVTKNFDFANGYRADMPEMSTLAKKYDIILGQECFTSNFRAMAKSLGWNAMQHREDEARAGSLIAWNPAKARCVNRGIYVGVDPKNHPGIESRIRTRYVVWGDFAIGSTMLHISSCHFPPPSDRGLSPYMAKNIVSDNERIDSEYIIGADWNDRGDNPYNVRNALDGKTYKNGIDGFIMSRNIKVVDRWVEPKRNSDHFGVGVKIQVKRLKADDR